MKTSDLKTPFITKCCRSTSPSCNAVVPHPNIFPLSSQGQFRLCLLSLKVNAFPFPDEIWVQTPRCASSGCSGSCWIRVVEPPSPPWHVPTLGWGFQETINGPRSCFEQTYPYQKRAELLCTQRGIGVEYSCQPQPQTKGDLQACARISWVTNALWAASSLSEPFIQPRQFPLCHRGPSL